MDDTKMNKDGTTVREVHSHLDLAETVDILVDHAVDEMDKKAASSHKNESEKLHEPTSPIVSPSSRVARPGIKEIRHLVKEDLKTKAKQPWRATAVSFLQPIEIPSYIILNITACYCLGSYNFGLIWIILLFLPVVFVYSLRLKRYSDMLRENTEKFALKSKISTHYESAEWINLMFRRIWSVYEPALSTQIQDQVNKVLSDACPSFIKSIKLAEFTLGSEPPQIIGAKGFPDTNSDIVHMDMDILFVPKISYMDSFMDPLRKSDPKTYAIKIMPTVSLGKGPLSLTIPLSIQDLHVYAKSRIQLSLMPAIPVVKIAQLCLREPPIVDFTVKPLNAINIMDLPLLSNTIHAVVQNIVSGLLVNPNRLILNLDDIVNKARLTSERCIGVIRIVLFSAHLQRRTDSHLVLEKDGKHIDSTDSVVDTADPVWNSCFYILIQDERSVLECSVLSGASAIGNVLSKSERILGICNFKISDGTMFKNENKGNESSAATKSDLPTDKLKPIPPMPLVEPPASTMALKSMDGHTATGELLYSLGYYPIVRLETEEGSVLPRQDILATYQSGILRFTVHSAKDLVIRGSVPRPMNTFVEVLICGMEEEELLWSGNGVLPSTVNQWDALWIKLLNTKPPVFHTKLKKTTNYPIWESSYDVLVKDVSACTLLIRLVEETEHLGDVLTLGLLNGKKVLAYYSITLEDALSRDIDDPSENQGDSGGSHSEWLTLGSAGNVLESGKLRFSCHVDPLPVDLSGVSSAIIPPYRPAAAILHLQLLESLNIATLFADNAGLFGDLKSTPKSYIRVSFCGRELFRSGTELVSDFNPLYCMDASCHAISIIRSLNNSEEIVAFEVYQAATVSSKDILVAVCELPVSTILNGDYSDSWIRCSLVGKFAERQRSRLRRKSSTSSKHSAIETNEDQKTSKPDTAELTIDIHVQMTVNQVESLDSPAQEDLNSIAPDESPINNSNDIPNNDSNWVNQLKPGLNILSVSFKEVKQLPEKQLFAARILSSSIFNTVDVPFSGLHTGISTLNSSEIEEILDIPVILPERGNKDSRNVPFAIFQLFECRAAIRRIDWQKLTKLSYESPISYSDLLNSKSGSLSLILTHASETNPSNLSSPELHISIRLKHVLNDISILPFLMPIFPPCLLTLTLIKGSQLMPVDSNGKADPFVTVYLNGLKMAKSKTIKKTLNPIWSNLSNTADDKDSENSEFSLPLINPNSSIVTLHVKDWNRVDVAIPMGETNIYIYRELLELALSRNESMKKIPMVSGERTFELLNCTTGNITVKLAFQDVPLEGPDDQELDPAQGLLVKKYVSSLAQYNSELKEYQSSRNMLLMPIDFLGNSVLGTGKFLGKTMFGTGKLLGTGVLESGKILGAGALGTGKLLGAGAFGTGKLLGTGALESGKLFGEGAVGTGKLLGSGVVKSGQVLGSTAAGTAHVLESTAGFASKPFKKMLFGKGTSDQKNGKSSNHDSLLIENSEDVQPNSQSISFDNTSHNDNPQSSREAPIEQEPTPSKRSLFGKMLKKTSSNISNAIDQHQNHPLSNRKEL